MDKTIILASHLLDEVQKVCSHFCVLQRGRKIFQGSIEEVTNQKSHIEVNADSQELLLIALNEFELVQSVEKKNGVFAVQGDRLSPQLLNEHLFRKGIMASHLVKVKSNLEEQFLEILKDHDR